MSLLAIMLSSKLRAEIFRIFFGIEDKEIHLREIERRSGFSIGTVRQETAKLVGLKLLIRRKDGNRTYFRANKQHPIYFDIHNIVLKTSGLPDLLTKHLYVPEVHFAFVFGSLASGTENDKSDIDLFVIGTLGLRTISVLLKEPKALVNREINTIVMSQNEFLSKLNSGDHFVNQVMESAKIMLVGAEYDLEQLGEERLA